MLKSNKEKSLSSDMIAKKLNVNLHSIFGTLGKLKNKGEIKIVGSVCQKSGTVKGLYACKESSLQEIEFVEVNNGVYTTLNNFFNNNSALMKKHRFHTNSYLLRFVKENNLQYFLASTQQGLRRCYLEKDLLNLFKNNITNQITQGNIERSTSKKYGKRNKNLAIL